MLRKAAAKALWVTKGMALFGGAVVTLALMFGVASVAFGANGDNLVLGDTNVASALTRLTGSAQGAQMEVQNNDPGANDTALSLKVQPGEPPMEVLSGARVDNLNSDKLDGKDSQAFVSSDVYEVNISRLVSPNSERYATVDCDDGDLIIGGGFGGLESRSVALQSERGDSGWQLGILNGASNLTDQVRLQAVCADFPPLHD